MNVDKLQEGLRTKRFGRRIFYTRVVSSTNDWAKKIAKQGTEEGTVAIAETQTAGRGRMRRLWVSPEGGLYFSVILRPKMKPTEAVKLVFVAGLAVAEVLHEKLGLKVETKWSNDVLVNGRKVCGILSEMHTAGDAVDFVVLGVGVNVNFERKALPEELRASASTLKTELGRKVKVEELFWDLLGKLEEEYELLLKVGFGPVLEKWRKYAGFLGRQVEVSNGSEQLAGVAVNVDVDGALVLRLEGGTIKRAFVGDVSLRMDSSVKFEVGCSVEEFKPYYEKCGIVEQPGIVGGELTPEWERLLTENPQWLSVWKLGDKIVGHAIWHPSSTEEYRKGDRREDEDKEILERLLGGKGDFVELHEVWLMEEYRGRGYGKQFFEWFEGFMKDRGYDSVIYYAFHPAALAVCRERNYKEAYWNTQNWHVFHITP